MGISLKTETKTQSDMGSQIDYFTDKPITISLLPRLSLGAIKLNAHSELVSEWVRECVSEWVRQW